MLQESYTAALWLANTTVANSPDLTGRLQRSVRAQYSDGSHAKDCKHECEVDIDDPSAEVLDINPFRAVAWLCASIFCRRPRAAHLCGLITALFSLVCPPSGLTMADSYEVKVDLMAASQSAGTFTYQISSNEAWSVMNNASRQREFVDRAKLDYARQLYPPSLYGLSGWKIAPDVKVEDVYVKQGDRTVWSRSAGVLSGF